VCGQLYTRFVLWLNCEPFAFVNCSEHTQRPRIKYTRISSTTSTNWDGHIAIIFLVKVLAKCSNRVMVSPVWLLRSVRLGLELILGLVRLGLYAGLSGKQVAC